MSWFFVITSTVVLTDVHIKNRSAYNLIYSLSIHKMHDCEYMTLKEMNIKLVSLMICSIIVNMNNTSTWRKRKRYYRIKNQELFFSENIIPQHQLSARLYIYSLWLMRKETRALHKLCSGVQYDHPQIWIPNPSVLTVIPLLLFKFYFVSCLFLSG